MRYVFCITNHGVYIVEPWEIELVDNADSEIELVQIMTAMR